MAEVVERARVRTSSLGKPREGEAFFSRAAQVAGLPVGQMMTVLAEFGVESRIAEEDYLQGLGSLAKVW